MSPFLTDRARAQAVKRGGVRRDETLPDEVPGAPDAADHVLAVDGALGRLAQRDPELGRIVELRFFGGLEMEDITAVLGVSPRTDARR